MIPARKWSVALRVSRRHVEADSPSRALIAALAVIVLAAPLPADDQTEATPAETPESTGTEEDAAAPPRILPLEFNPYAVEVAIAFAGDPVLNASYRQSLVEAVRTRLRTRFGRMWELSIREDRSWSPVLPDGLARRSDEGLNQQYLDGQFDKVMLVGVTHTSGRYDAFAREWDRDSQTSSAMAAGNVYDRRLTADLITDLVSQVFRPIARLEEVEEDRIEMMIRAGELLPGESDAAQFQPGDYLTPYYRYLTRQREIRKIDHVPWTLLHVTSVDRRRMNCEVITTFRPNPLAGVRRYTLIMGMRARPLLPATDLRVAPRTAPVNPLVGVHIDVMDRLPTEEDAVEDRLSFLTDRSGVVTVAADPDNPLRHVLIHSGASVLASVPFMPGLLPNLELLTPDDSARLDVEGKMALLKSDLIDIVARRAVLMSQARKAAKAGNWDEADSYTAQLRELPTLEQIQLQIEEDVRIPAATTAKRLNDRVAEIRINRLCRDVAAIAEKFLDPDKINEFRTEMNELRTSSR